MWVQWVGRDEVHRRVNYVGAVGEVCGFNGRVWVGKVGGCRVGG